MSGHFETDDVAVVIDPKPGIIYDFGGFALELCKMAYPAAAEPALSAKVFMLEKDRLRPHIYEKCGYDHVAWTLMKLALPDADIPIMQVSIDLSLDAAQSHAIGKAPAPLRDHAQSACLFQQITAWS